MEDMTGNIYKLTCSKDDTYYIGCTISSIEERLAFHKDTSAPYKRTSKLYTHYDTIGWDNVSVSLIINIPIRDFDELHIYESKYICKALDDPNCLNMMPSFSYSKLYLTKKEFLNLPVDTIYNLNLKYCERIGSYIIDPQRTMASDEILYTVRHELGMQKKERKKTIKDIKKKEDLEIKQQKALEKKKAKELSISKKEASLEIKQNVVLENPSILDFIRNCAHSSST